MAASLKLRSSLDSPCQGKRIYKSEKEAKGVARWLRKKNAWGCGEHPYFCKHCKAWHLTSDKPRKGMNGKHKLNR